MKDMPNNKVVTAKYNIFNFLPLNLCNQLSKAQNLYFIMISCMQTIRAISISAGKAVQAAPLIVVMILSILKDLYEDLKRHRQDAEENNQSATMWNEDKQKFEKVDWWKIQVGSILKIESDQPMPCDLLLTKSSDPKGVCYVETKSLDGETNLKMKTVHKDLIQKFSNKSVKDYESNPTFDCKIQCEAPNNGIYKFEGIMEMDSKSLSLGPENMFLRGSMLRNTEAAFGIVIFTGHETKVMQNAAKSAPKWSNLESKTN